MVSSEEISRRLELKRKGLKPDETLKSQYEPKSIGNEKHAGKKITCPECQTVNLETSKYCVGCGYEILKTSDVTKETSNDFILCPECNSKNKKDSKFCIKCGNELPKTNSIICPECEFENTATSKFCIGCGAKLEVSAGDIIEEAPVEKVEEPDEISLEIKEKVTEDQHEIPEEEPQKDQDKLEIEDEEADALDKIKKAKELLDIGAISEEEYEKIKNRCLEEINK